MTEEQYEAIRRDVRNWRVATALMSVHCGLWIYLLWTIL